MFKTDNFTKNIFSIAILGALSASLMGSAAYASGDTFGAQDWTSGQHHYDDTTFSSETGYTVKLSKAGTDFSGNNITINGGAIGFAVEEKANAVLTGDNTITGKQSAVSVYGGTLTLSGNTTIKADGEAGLLVGGGGSLHFDGDAGHTKVSGGLFGLETNSGGSMDAPTIVTGSNLSLDGGNIGLYAASGISRITLSDISIQSAGYGMHISGSGIKGGNQVALDHFSVAAKDMGVLVALGGELTLKSGKITSGGYGVYALMENAKVRLEDVSVVTTGEGARGLLANGDGVTGGYIYATQSSVLTTGKGAHGVQTNAGGSIIDLDRVAIETRGESAHGIFSNVGDVTILGGTIVTLGERASAAYANKNGAVLIDKTELYTKGNGASGIRLVEGGYVGMTNSLVETSGVDSHAILFSKSQLQAGDVVFHNYVKMADSVVEAKNAYAIHVKDGGIAELEMSGGAISGGQGLYYLNTQNTTSFASGLNLSATDGALLVGRGIIASNARGGEVGVPDDIGGVNVTLTQNSRWIVDGNSEVTNLTLQDSVLIFAENRFENDQNGTVAMRVQGDFTGQDAILVFNASQDADHRLQSDHLLIEGDAYGRSQVHILDRGAIAYMADDSMNIIIVKGNVEYGEEAFSFASDYRYKGTDVIAGGAYVYKINYQDGDEGKQWSLQLLSGTDGNAEKPVYGAATPLYEAYPQALMMLNGGGSLSQRTAQRVWMTGTIEDRISDQTGFWMQVEGATGKYSPQNSTSSSNFDYDLIRTKMGFDATLLENHQGVLIGGLFVQYGHIRADVSSDYGQGSISSDGYGFGGTLTWYDHSGLYIDAQAQAMWYESSIYSRSHQGENGFDSDMTTGNKGFGTYFSVEVGKKYQISELWSMTPQVQLSYQKVTFDNFRDFVGADVHLKNADRLEGRIGVEFERSTEWLDAQNKTRSLRLKVNTNLYQPLSGNSRVSVSNVDFQSKSDHTQAGIGIGANYSWNDGAYSLYGTVDARSQLDNGKNYQLGGTIGFKASF